MQTVPENALESKKIKETTGKSPGEEEEEKYERRRARPPPPPRRRTAAGSRVAADKWTGGSTAHRATAERRTGGGGCEPREYNTGNDTEFVWRHACRPAEVFVRLERKIKYKQYLHSSKRIHFFPIHQKTSEKSSSSSYNNTVLCQGGWFKYDFMVQ